MCSCCSSQESEFGPDATARLRHEFNVLLYQLATLAQHPFDDPELTRLGQATLYRAYADVSSVPAGSWSKIVVLQFAGLVT